MSKVILGAFLCLAFVNAISAYYVSTDLGECPQICPDIYMPVCGTDGEVYKEFPNSCELGVSNCKPENNAVKPLVQTDYDWCSTTYVENLYEILGSADMSNPDCMKACPLNYSPVCVSNGKYRGTVSNECEMEYLNCLVGLEDNSNLYSILKKDAC